MLVNRKNMTEASMAIFKEQRQLRKERLLASPALIIGVVGFAIILLAAIFVPIISNVDPNAMEVSSRLAKPGGKFLLGADEFGRDLFIV